MTNAFQQFCAHSAATANPNAASAILWWPLLETFLTRFMDCLFNRPGGGATPSDTNAPATDDEWPEPLEVAAEDDWISKAQAVQSRLRQMESGRRGHAELWGGYKPASVRRGMATLRRTVRENGLSASEYELRQQVISVYDNASGLRVEELAKVLKDEASRQPTA